MMRMITSFPKIIKTGLERDNIELHAYCLMPNHFHLLLVPQGENSLSKFMQWVMTSMCVIIIRKQTSEHIWQGRFKSFIVEKDSYYLTLMRYIEANALRADLSKTAQDWQYRSLSEKVF
ncbi:MAG: transposase [Candidatus Thiodubiliella endoseptemdiera]|uniref:Transposase n=1 Tax=Candidatus Thiodubiliella endoseptemdiera TaxID=2738886 RepID=A0A853F2V2_9GAMM|nr:transposase [Candidatus Thiodubiliella endoseptemdiera]